MKINLVPDFSLIAAPVATILGNLLSVAGQQAAGGDNVIQYSAPARIEPRCIIDAALNNFEDLHPILRTINSITAAYYLQAIGRGINTESAILLRVIDQVRPDRNLLAAAGQFAESSLNEYYGESKTLEARGRDRIKGAITGIATEALALPDPSRPSTLTNLATREAVALEGTDGKTVERLNKEEVARRAASAKAISGTVKGGEKDIMEAPNLAVGKIFDVTATFGENTVTLPIVVALNTVLSTSDNLVDLYTIGANRNTFGERLSMVKSGELRFWADFVGMEDLIKEHKRAAIMDNTGTYMENRERDSKNRITAILTGKTSLATASNIAVISDRTARKIEAGIGGKLDSVNIRNKLFERTYLSMLYVVSPEWKMITIYHRGVPHATEMPIGEFTRAKSKQGSDVSDLIQMFMAGKQLTL